CDATSPAVSLTRTPGWKVSPPSNDVWIQRSPFSTLRRETAPDARIARTGACPVATTRGLGSKSTGFACAIRSRASGATRRNWVLIGDLVSEHQPQPELNLPRRCRRRRDAAGASDRTRGGEDGALTRDRKIRMIQHVEEFRAELERHALAQPELPVERQVEARKPRAGQGVPAEVAVEAGLGQSEG